ncbi:MAG: hypothetical protein SGPRY_002413 [Prymnesium sp.]
MLVPEPMLALPRPALPLDSASPATHLAPPLRTLARALHPQRIVIDCGGQGQCGPNSIAFLLGLAGGPVIDGPQLRTVVADHSLGENVLAKASSVIKDGSPLSFGSLIKECVSAWPVAARGGQPATVDVWQRCIRQPDTWVDIAFIQLAADAFGVAIHVIAVNDLSAVASLGVLVPADGVPPTALIEVGSWTGRHLVAIADALASAAALPMHLTAPSPHRSPKTPSGSISLSALCCLMRKPNSPTILVACEFSGTLSSALRRQGFSVLTADLRPSDHSPVHYQGDVRDVLHLRRWERFYAFPPCFQQLRGDTQCLPSKIQDGRAYWGCLLALAGKAFVWCTLAALAGTPCFDPASRSVLSARMFIEPVERMPDSPLASIFRSGVSSARSLLQRPPDDSSTPAWAALRRMLASDAMLRESVLDSVAAGDRLLADWAERILPFDVAMIPSHLLEHLPDFSDGRLDEIRLSPVQIPLRTPWLPLAPPQPAVGAGAPTCVRRVRELLLPSARQALTAWTRAAREDLIHIRDFLAAGGSPKDISRERPAPIAIGQTELYPWARGLVWDCTKLHHHCCYPMDFTIRPDTHLHVDYLGDRLAHYPDQTLVSHLLEGVRLEADVELQTVLVPHLGSLPLGFASVESELRRLRNLTWYEFYDDFPYWPMYMNGQGATARKLEERYRRTTEGGGPRQPVYDASGLQAISINVASRNYHMPQHFLTDRRPEFLEWLRARGLPSQQAEPLAADPNKRFTKWPKERKPTLAMLERDLAVLKRAGEVVGAPVYSIGNDFKDYFNQLAIATPDLHKLGIVFLAKDRDLDSTPPARLPDLHLREAPWIRHSRGFQCGPAF